MRRIHSKQLVQHSTCKRRRVRPTIRLIRGSMPRAVRYPPSREQVGWGTALPAVCCLMLHVPGLQMPARRRCPHVGGSGDELCCNEPGVIAFLAFQYHHKRLVFAMPHSAPRTIPVTCHVFSERRAAPPAGPCRPPTARGTSLLGPCDLCLPLTAQG